MKKIITALALAALFSSCNETEEKPEETKVFKLTEDSLQTKLDTATMLVVSAPDVFDNSDDVIFTVHYNTLEGKRGIMEKLSSSSYDYDSYGGYSQPEIKNVIFSNLKTGESQLLCDTNMHITDMEYVLPDSANHFRADNSTTTRYKTTPLYILYKIQLRDWNKDKRIDSHDPTTLFMSDAKGKNFIPLIKPDEKIWDWNLSADRKQLILHVHEDSNHDLEFNEKDKVSVRIIDLQSPSFGKGFFDKAFLNKLYQIKPKF